MQEISELQHAIETLKSQRELALVNQRLAPQYGVHLQMRTGIHTAPPGLRCTPS